jgi:PKD repeat protein
MPETPLVGESVSFAATEPLMGTPPFTYTWDFGDGFGDVGQAVNHAYGAADDYEVTLMVENACGEASIAETVTVEMGMHYIYLPIVVKNDE